jgi:hypothetical protein
MSKPKDLRDGADAPATPVPQPASQPVAIEPEAPVVAVAPEPPLASPRRAVDSAAPAPLAAADAFHFRFFPALLAVVMVAALWPKGLPQAILDSLTNFVAVPGIHGPLGSEVSSHLMMLALAAGVIYLLQRQLPQIDFGLHLPRGRSYVATAIILGLLAGVVMALVDNAPSLISHSVPRGYDTGYGVGVSQMPGWLLYYGLLVGPTEEIPYRALILAYLTMSMPGRVRIRGLEMNGANVVLAAIFTIGFGFYALVSSTFLVAIGQILYVFLGTLALAYWFEKSRSVLAPIIGHNVASVTWQALTFAIVIAFR